MCQRVVRGFLSSPTLHRDRGLAPGAPSTRHGAPGHAPRRRREASDARATRPAAAFSAGAVLLPLAILVPPGLIRVRAWVRVKLLVVLLALVRAAMFVIG